MVCAPGSTCDYPTGTGLSGADLTDEQKQLLLNPGRTPTSSSPVSRVRRAPTSTA